MSTYLKNMGGYKHNQLKNKAFEDIQMLFDKEMRRVNIFVDIDTELVKGSKTRAEGSSKRAGEELESENLKKQIDASEILKRDLETSSWKVGFKITTARRVSTVRRIKGTRGKGFKMKIVYQDYLRDKYLEKVIVASRPRVSVKGHILADFIVERPEEESLDTLMEVEEELPEPWILFKDGSSCTDGSGA
ncbi:hypothetical protein Tco_0827349 [Tanacetum coccineum]